MLLFAFYNASARKRRLINVRPDVPISTTILSVIFGYIGLSTQPGSSRLDKKQFFQNLLLLIFLSLFLILSVHKLYFLSGLNFLAVDFEMRIVCHFRISPQRQHCNCQFSCDSNFCFLPGNTSSSLCNPIAEITQITILAEWSHDILRSLYKQPSQKFIAAFCYSELFIHLSGLIPLGDQSSV